MKNELFGVFGDANDFRRYRSETSFDCVVEGDSATVGIRDDALGVPGRSSVHDDDGICILWGEVYPPREIESSTAQWFLERYRERGLDALSALNGSFLVAVDDGDGGVVATDPARTWECYYADVGGRRLFGTDPHAIAEHIPSTTTSTQGLLEFLHLGVVLGERTTIEELHRTPFDGCLRRDSARELRRFVYDPEEFDYVQELADRLQRAFARRADLPGRKGLLLSAGYDSRTLLSGLPSLDRCFTVGEPTSAEVQVAKRVAEQYDVPHRTLAVDERYLRPDEDVIEYGHGIKESLHIHHAAYDDEIDVDTIYHGLLWDTFFRGHFLPNDCIDLFGYEIPRTRLEPNPDLAETLVDRKFGFFPTEKPLVADAGTNDGRAVALDGGGETNDAGRAIALDAVRSELDGQADRYDSIYNAIDLVGIRNQPTTPFRTHLADQYVESFVVADRELIDWHLRTPPEYRNSETLLKAIRRIDDDVLRYRPPDRPYDSTHLNTAQNFVRKQVPFVSGFDGSWPNRTTQYERNQLDERLFPDCPEVHDLPPRLKLRLNDISTWLDGVSDESSSIPSETLCSTI
jgi:asparagine synthase (glutamine-hydrolysing)